MKICCTSTLPLINKSRRYRSYRSLIFAVIVGLSIQSSGIGAPKNQSIEAQHDQMFMDAVRSGDVRRFKMLLNTPYLSDAVLSSGLNMAIQKCMNDTDAEIRKTQMEIAETLLDNGVEPSIPNLIKPGSPYLAGMLYNNHNLEIVKLVDKLMDIKKIHDAVHSADEHGTTFMHYIAAALAMADEFTGDELIVLEHAFALKASISEKNDLGCTPLMAFVVERQAGYSVNAYEKNLKIFLKYLTVKQMNVRDNAGYSAVDHAQIYNAPLDQSQGLWTYVPEVIALHPETANWIKLRNEVGREKGDTFVDVLTKAGADKRPLPHDLPGNYAFPKDYFYGK